MAKQPVTQAVRVLRKHKVAFEGFPYVYRENGGTAHFAELFAVDEHLVIKTLILQDDQRQPLVALMHGDLQVSTRKLARAMGVRSIVPCEPKVADRHSGYQVGGTSPFGLRNPLPIYCQQTISVLPEIYINGGKRGYILRMTSTDLLRVLEPELLDMAA